MLRRLFTLVSGLSLLLCANGCCSFPGVEQVQRWVATELPAGSTEDDVRRFSRAHGFEYRELEAGSNAGMAEWKPRGVCYWLVPTVDVRVSYDGARRVRATQVGSQAIHP
jgi:hypothetical protein